MTPATIEVAVGAIIVADAHVLLIERGRPPAAGLWSVPGGRVEPGESLADALVREVMEETGLEVTCGPFIGWVERTGPGYHFLIMDFFATPFVGGLPPAVAGDDASAAEWVPIGNLSTYPLVDGLAAFLHDHGVV